MSTDFQQARLALTTRLRELRTENGLTGRELAASPGWANSMGYKFETRGQTAARAGLEA